MNYKLSLVCVGIIGFSLGSMARNPRIHRLWRVIKFQEELILWTSNAVVNGMDAEDFSRQYIEKNQFLEFALLNIAEGDPSFVVVDDDTGEKLS